MGDSENARISKSSHALLDYPLWPNYVATFMHFMAFTMGGILYPVLMADTPSAYAGIDVKDGVPTMEQAMMAVGRGAQLYAVIFLANNIGELLTSGLIGVLCDRVGRRPMAICTQLGQLVEFGGAFVVSVGGTPTSPAPRYMKGGFMLMVLARACSGLAGNIKIPSVSYVADVSTKSTAPTNYGYSFACVGLGIIGGAIMSLLTVGIGDSTPLGGLGFTYLVCCLCSLGNITLIALKWPRFVPEHPAPWSDALPWKLVQRTIGKSRALMMYGVMNFFDSFSLNMMITTSTLAFIGIFQQSKTIGQLYFVVYGLIGALTQGPLLKCVLGKMGEVGTLKLGYIVSCGGFVLMFILGLQPVWVVFFLSAIPMGFGVISQPMQTGFAVRLVSWEDQGRLSGAYGILETLGKLCAAMLGPNIFSATFAGPMPGMVYLVAAIVLAPGVFLAFKVSQIQEVEESRMSKALTKPTTTPALPSTSPSPPVVDETPAPQPETIGDKEPVEMADAPVEAVANKDPVECDF